MNRISSLRDRLKKVYGEQTPAVLTAIEAEFADLTSVTPEQVNASRWSERDVVLITYADQIRSAKGSPLTALRRWLVENDLQASLSTVHLLPFCPYSSDDGFSVIDYLAVDPEAGTWDDIAALGHDFALMFDLVLNHASSQSEWFQAYLRGEAPYDRFFYESDPTKDPEFQKVVQHFLRIKSI